MFKHEKNASRVPKLFHILVWMYELSKWSSSSLNFLVIYLKCEFGSMTGPSYSKPRTYMMTLRLREPSLDQNVEKV